MLENADHYQNLLTKRDNLIREKDSIEAFIGRAERSQDLLRYKIDNEIREEAIYLLNNDLHRQDEFKSANEFHIDYSSNISFWQANIPGIPQALTST